MANMDLEGNNLRPSEQTSYTTEKSSTQTPSLPYYLLTGSLSATPPNLGSTCKYPIHVALPIHGCLHTSIDSAMR